MPESGREREVELSSIHIKDKGPSVEAERDESRGPERSACQCVQSFLYKWHLPLGLVVMVVFGLLYPPPGRWMGDNTPASTICVVIIFLITGINLQTDEIVQALRDWIGIVAGLVLVLGITPLVGLIIQLIPLDSVPVLNGLALFFAMPTTISSGLVLTEQAKGSKAMAVCFSVTSNLLAVFTCPPFISILLRSSDPGSESSGIDVGSILWKLSLTVCLPLVAGKAIQMLPRVQPRVRAVKSQTKLLASFFLVLIPWMKVSQAFGEISLLTGGTIGAIIGIGAGCHVLLLLVCAGVALLLPITNANRKAIIITCSQKTIAIAAAFLALLPASMLPGIMVIPAIISHFAQIIIDAFVATWLASALPTPELAEEAGADEGDRASLAAAGDREATTEDEEEGAPPTGALAEDCPSDQDASPPVTAHPSQQPLRPSDA